MANLKAKVIFTYRDKLWSDLVSEALLRSKFDKTLVFVKGTLNFNFNSVFCSGKNKLNIFLKTDQAQASKMSGSEALYCYTH